MTALEIERTISNLKEVLISGNILLEKMEKAQKDLETPPPHKWGHGDVFLNEFGITMIYIRGMAWGNSSPEHVFCISGSCDCAHNPKDFLKKGKFLFNIKEKL